MNPPSATYRVVDWVGRYAELVLVGVVLIALTLGVVGPLIDDTDEPSFDPKGEVFETYARAGETLRSGSHIAGETFVIEPAPPSMW